MAKIRCPKCGERNDITNKVCLYCDGKLKALSKTKKQNRLGFIKNQKFYIPSFVLLGIIVIGMASLLVWKPGIAKGEYGFNEILMMISGQGNKLESLKTKTTPNTPNSQTTPTPTATVKPNTNLGSETEPKPSGNGDFHISTVCKDIAIPYETEYSNDSSMYVGDTRVGIAGINGVKKDCTKTYDGKDWAQYYGLVKKDVYDEIWPKTALVYVGTKPITSTPTTPTYTYEQALQIARNTGTCMQIAQASGTGSSAYQLCLNLVMKDYGYEYHF